MKMKQLTSLLLAGILSVTALSGCGNKSAAEKSELDTITKSGKLKIGYTEYAPMNYTGEDGKLTGFDTEFAEAVCKQLGVEPDFVEIVWDTKNVSLESGEIDCIWNGMTITDDLKSNFSISSPYAQNTQVVITKTENKDIYSDFAKLSDKTIALEAGSAAQSVAEEDDNLKGANIVTVTKQTDALLEIKSGTADAAIFDQTMADTMIGKGTDFSDLVVCGVFHKEEYGVAFRKNSDLTAKFNDIMTSLNKDGTLPALAEKYGLTLA